MKNSMTPTKVSKSPSVMMILFARDYSSKKAAGLFYKWHIENDGELTADYMHSTLAEEQAYDKHFIYESIDWNYVKSYLESNLGESISGVIK